MKNKQPKKLPAGESVLYLLRHGEIAAQGILAGKTDIPLSDIGRNQIVDITASLKNINHCISSPLVRCHEMAQLFAAQHDLPLVVESDLQEMNFGDWDGKRYQELWDIPSSEGISGIGDFWQNPWQHQPPNGEKMSDFVNRVDSWWNNFQNTNDRQNTLVFTHGGVIKHLLARVLNLPIPGTDHMRSIEVPYAGLIKISLYRDESGKTWSKIVL